MIQKYVLNFVPGKMPIRVRASQYDKSLRIIQMEIMNGDAPFVVPEGSTVLVRGTKQDLTGFEYECSYNSNIVEFEIRDQMTIFAGRYPSEIRIVKDNKIIGSANFEFDIEESPLSEDTIISETQLPLLEEALEAASEAEQYKLDAEAWAVGERNGVPVSSDDETYENNAKYYADESKESANDSAEAAGDALEYKNNASASADSAEADALKSEGFAVGKQDGVDVESGSPYYHNNAEWYAHLAEQGAENSGYAFFEVNENDGQVYVTVTEELDSDLVFHVNTGNGELEVIVL